MHCQLENVQLMHSPSASVAFKRAAMFMLICVDVYPVKTTPHPPTHTHTRLPSLIFSSNLKNRKQRGFHWSILELRHKMDLSSRLCKVDGCKHKCHYSSFSILLLCTLEFRPVTLPRKCRELLLTISNKAKVTSTQTLLPTSKSWSSRRKG